MIKQVSTNIVMPMAGRGQRFLDHGILEPKPLVKLGDRSIVHWIVQTLGVPDARFIFIVREEHVSSHGIDDYLKRTVPGCEVLVIDKVTEGAVCTVLLASAYFDNDAELIVKDCDQIINWNAATFLEFVRRRKADGAIVTIGTQNPGFSYARLGEDHTRIVETREKQIISMFGCSGLYYFAKGSEFVRYARAMVAKNIRVNNEFYVSPVYNEYIEDDKSILNYPIAEMFSFNTPEELARNDQASLEFLRARMNGG